MKNILNETIEQILHSRRDYRRYVAIFLVLAMATTLCVNWALHQNGISLSQTADYVCGLEEHHHDDSCYASVLTCTQEEREGIEGHTHGDSCYDEEDNLVCPQKEQASVEGHTHTEACYERQLTCTLEEHTHVPACLGGDDTADLETATVWESTLPTDLTGIWADDLVRVAQSQLGYAESTVNYIFSDDGTQQRGYTRYGAWYGNEYANWTTMFAAFCLHYTGISTNYVPTNSGVNAWIVNLKNANLYQAAGDYVPKKGDFVLLDEENADGTADHVGIIESVSADEDGNVTGITAVVGDLADAVAEVTCEIGNAAIVGYASLPENPNPPESTDGEDPEDTPQEPIPDEDADTEIDTDGEAGEEPADGEQEEAELTYPAFTYEQTMEDGTVISVDAPEGAFPEGIQLNLTKKDVADYLEPLRSFTGNSELTAENWLAYDFDFYTDEEHHNIEPMTEIRVTFSNLSNLTADLEAEAALVSDEASDETEETGESTYQVAVFHISAPSEDGAEQVSRTTVSDVDVESGIVEIETSEFSTQVVTTAVEYVDNWGGHGGGGNKTTVDHIDIGIAATATVTLNGKEQTVKVTLEQSDFTAGNVSVSAKYQTGTATPSFDTNNFSKITTSSGTSGISQYRVEGTYAVGTLSNPVIYTFTLKKNVTFEIDGQTVTLPVTLSQSFHYFQYDNDCPGIHNHENTKGTVSDASGLDFVLKFEMELISINKQVVDENGDALVVPNYTVYFNVNKSSDPDAAKILLENASSGWVIEQVTTRDNLTITEDTPPSTVEIDGVTYSYMKTLINDKEGNSYTVATDASSFTVKNYYEQSKTIQLTKTDANDSTKLLPGAQFTLTSGEGDSLVYYNADGTTSTEQVILTTGEDGTLSVSGLFSGTYSLTEIQAPDGYNTLTEPIKVVIEGSKLTYNGTEVTASDGVFALTVANEPGFTLPDTGGAGTTLYAAAGVVLMGMSLLAGCSLRRRRERRVVR